MKSTGKLLIAVAGLFALGACVEDSSSSSSNAPTVGSSTNVSSFEGARAGQAENGLRNLGYTPVRSQGLTTWWFNRSTGACARITTSDGRYSDVTMLPAEDC